MLSVTFDQDIENRLEALGATDKDSKVALVQDRLRAALQEGLDDLRIARQRRRNPGRRWTQEELERGLESRTNA
ncbi:MAG TPA: hypothetical protein VGG06_02200 [Thermoanaerobaculia bacterium]|jgi:hypothetical protein